MEVKKISTKGMFMTSAMILLTSIIIISYVVDTNVQSNFKSKKERIISMNNFISDIELDFQRSLYISSFRSLVSLQNEILNTGNFSSRWKLEELLINGTINGNNVDIMKNSSLNNWAQKMNNISNNVGIDENFEFSNFYVYQKGSWYVNFNITSLESFEDKKHIAHWNRNITVEASVPIDGQIDPIYSIYTNGKILKSVSKCNYNNFVTLLKSGTGSKWAYGYVNYTDSETNANSSRIVVSNDMSSWSSDTINTFLGAVSTSFPSNVTVPHVKVSDVSGLPEKILINEGKIYDIENLRNFLFDGCYKDSNGPSYLMRLEGNLSNSKNGIESFVNIDELKKSGVHVTNGISCIDYMYFSNNQTTAHKIKGMPDWFYLDDDHLDDYNCTDITLD